MIDNQKRAAMQPRKRPCTCVASDTTCSPRLEERFRRFEVGKALCSASQSSSWAFFLDALGVDRPVTKSNRWR